MRIHFNLISLLLGTLLFITLFFLAYFIISLLSIQHALGESLEVALLVNSTVGQERCDTLTSYRGICSTTLFSLKIRSNSTIEREFCDSLMSTDYVGMRFTSQNREYIAYILKARERCYSFVFDDTITDLY